MALASVVGSLWGYWHWQQRPQNSAQTSTTSQHGTAPAPPSYADQILATMSLRDKVASLFILHTPGTDPNALMAYLTTFAPSGLIFMGDNIPATFDELRAETSAVAPNKQLPPFIAIDEEGDTVKRLAADTYAGALTLRSQPPVATRDAFAQRSEMLKSVGINLNFGIIADVTADPKSFIYNRVLGTTPQAASDRVAQAVQGSQGKTLTTLKHFPGHGETTANSHISIPTATTTYEDWQNRVALPFKAGIDAGANVVMFGHLRYGAVDAQPATLSQRWHEIIRNELDFKGVTITDDMLMLQNSGEAAYADPINNAIAAILAGNDLLLYVLNHGKNTNIDPATLIQGVVAAVNDGRIPASVIDEHARNVLTLRHQLGKTFYAQ